MAHIDARSEKLTQLEGVMERADCYRAALKLASEYEWAEPITPYDVLGIAQYLTEGLTATQGDDE